MEIEKIKSELKRATSDKESESNHVMEHVKAFKRLAKSLRENAQKLLELKNKDESAEAKLEAKEIIAKSFAALAETRLNQRGLYVVNLRIKLANYQGS